MMLVLHQQDCLLLVFSTLHVRAQEQRRPGEGRKKKRSGQGERIPLRLEVCSDEKFQPARQSFTFWSRKLLRFDI